MTEAKATWTEGLQFTGIATSGHAIILDGDKKTASSPIELSGCLRSWTSIAM